MGLRQFQVLAGNIDEELGTAPLVEDADYFAVKVLEMGLAKTQRWFVDRNPMLYVRTGFVYAGAQRQLPFVIGPPSAADAPGAPGPLPARVVAQNITAAGWHPYRGKGVSLLVALYSVPDDAQLTSMLALVDKVVTAAKLIPGLDTYLSVVEAVQQGVTTIGEGKGTTPVLAWQRHFDDAALRPGIWVLAGQDLEPRSTFVRDRRLVYGHSGGPPDGVDYVLLSIERTDEIKGAGNLPGIDFLRTLVNDYAGVPGEEAWDLARAHLASLALALLTSPDLTPSHAHRLAEVYRTGAKQTRAAVLAAAKRGEPVERALPRDADTALSLLRTDDGP